MAKSGVSLLLVGHQGCGKTTALAQLCADVKAFPEDQHEDCRRLAKEVGRPDYQHAWMLDRLRNEREDLRTVESSLQSFESGAFKYTALDTPGSIGLAKNMLSMTSLADIAVLVVSAKAKEWEADVDKNRTRELALCCFTMGIKHIAVWVTKLDDTSVDYAQDRFEDIKKAVTAFLKEVGYKQKEVPVVPISGLLGENLVSKSDKMDFYQGKPALEALDEMGPINRPADKPLRMPVFAVHSHPMAGTVVVGRVETGSVRTGTKIIFSPSGQTAEVESLQKDGQDASEAQAGEIVGVALGEAVDAADLRRGMVVSSPSNDTAAVAEQFLAQVIILDHPGTIRSGYCPSMAVHTAQVPCEFEELIAKIDRKTGQEAGSQPDSVKTGEVVTVRMRPQAPVSVEAFSAFPSLGRFAVRDHGRVVAVGVIKEVTKRPIPQVKPKGANEYFDN